MAVLTLDLGVEEPLAGSAAARYSAAAADDS
jgi:hypothetical protein